MNVFGRFGRFFLLVFAFSGLLPPLATPVALAKSLPSVTTTDFDRVEQGNIYFKNSTPGFPRIRPLKTGLSDLRYEGVLRPTDGEPYFFFTAKTCENCIEPPAIYVFRTSGGKPVTFVYPGRILEPKSRALLLDSRSFIGKCLSHKEDAFVTFQQEKIDRKRFLQSSVLVVEAAPAYLKENLVERHLPHISQTIKFVKQKVCREISGSNRLMLSKPLDIHPHHENDADEPLDENKRDELKKNDAAIQKAISNP